MDEQRFVQLLESLFSPDTGALKAATQELNTTYYPHPQSLSALLQIVSAHSSYQLRQLSAVEARKLVPKHWSKLDNKPDLRNALLQASLNEENKLVRHSGSRVVSSIAKVDFENSEWQDLPRLLLQACTSTQVRQREVGMYMIYTLMETMGDFFTENLPSLFQLFAKTIQDPESAEVRVNTMLTLSRVAMLVDGEDDPDSVKAFQELVPHMVNVLKATVDAGDESDAMNAFETFQTLLGCDAVLLNKHFADLVRFMMDLATEKTIDDDMRSQALAFLMQCARYRKLKLQGLRMGEELTKKALQIVPELGDLSSEDEEITPARSALGLLDILAGSLPPSQVVVPLLREIGPYVSHQDPEYRRAGILALGMCVEGAPDFIATQLKEILPMVLRLLEDPNVRVRAAALQGVARLSDDLAEEVGKEHALLVPAMVKNFDLAVQSLPGADEDLREEYYGIIRGSCNAIDSLIEGLEKEEAAIYVSELVPRLSQFFKSDDPRSQLAAIGAIGSIASAAESAFIPYFEATMHALGEYVTLKESQDELDLRGFVCDSMGKMAAAVGPVAFQQYVRPLMEASEQALHLDHPRLRETSYILWSTMSKVYEEEFSPYLDGVIKGLSDCLEQEEKDVLNFSSDAADLQGQEVTIGGKVFKVMASENEDEDEIINVDELDDDDDDFEDITNPVTAVAMEKEIAIEVIGDIVAHTRAKFVPHMERIIAMILPLCDHEYEGIRKSAISTLWRIYGCVWGLAEGQGMAKWIPGIPLQVEPPAELQKLGTAVMDATMGVWLEEMDRSTVTDINRDLAGVLKAAGPSILIKSEKSESLLKDLVSTLLQILTKRHPCQQDLGEDGEMDEDLLEESSEYDWLVVDTALDCVTCLAAALGSTFGELWKTFEKPIMKYVSSQEASERCAAIGCLSECISYMEGGCTPYTNKLLTVLMKRLGDEDPDTKANAMYGTGLLCEKSENALLITRNYNAIFAKLEPVLDEGTTANHRMLDNAAGCVARMIQAHPDNVPLSDVLPRLIDLLPVKEDYQENAPAFRCIIALFQAQNSEMLKLAPRIAPAITKALGPPHDQLDDETRAHLTELVAFMSAN
ncbi:ARM repeat-containing protein [Venturia nashicola]|nr:ARM repeat-containing protein [Venturia nashicola]